MWFLVLIFVSALLVYNILHGFFCHSCMLEECLCQEFLSWCSYRGGSRTVATSKMERFVIIVDAFQSLTTIAKRSILDVATVLDPPLVLTESLLSIVSNYVSQIKYHIYNVNLGDKNYVSKKIYVYQCLVLNYSIFTSQEHDLQNGKSQHVSDNQTFGNMI